MSTRVKKRVGGPRAELASPHLPAAPVASVVQPVPRPAPAAPGFEIVHTNILLTSSADRYSLFGDVARLSDGRHIARFSYAGCDGTTLWGYGDWSEDQDVTISRYGATDWAHRLRALATRIDAVPLQPCEKALEYQRMLAQFPVLAQSESVRAEFGAAAVPKTQLFPPGSVNYPLQIRGGGGWAPAWWRRYAELHCAGEWGVHSRFVAAQWTPDELWSRGELPMHVQNSIAIATRTGAIVSRFKLEPVDQEMFMRHERSPGRFDDRPTRFVEVISAPFLRSGAKTLLAIEESHDAHDSG